MIQPGYRERQDAQVAKQAIEQIKYCEDIMAKRGPKPKLNSVASQLGEALAFVSVAGTKDYKHVWLEANEACMTDGQLFAGYPIVEDLNCCPQLKELRQALSKCGKSLALTELPGKLSVKGDKLTAVIPCMDAADLPDIEADPLAGAVDDKLKEAFKVCGVLADENGVTVIEASLLLETNVCSSTDRKVAMQYWHGLQLPPEKLVVPKIFTQAVAKQTLAIVGMGWTPGRSITIHFENGAWLKTLLYADPWPDVDKLFPVDTVEAIDVPEGFAEGVEAIKDANDNHVYFYDGKVKSHNHENTGFEYEVEGLKAGPHLSAESIKDWLPLVKKWNTTEHKDRITFYGENLRGVTTTIVGE